MPTLLSDKDPDCFTLFYNYLQPIWQGILSFCNFGSNLISVVFVLCQMHALQCQFSTRLDSVDTCVHRQWFTGIRRYHYAVQ